MVSSLVFYSAVTFRIILLIVITFMTIILVKQSLKYRIMVLYLITSANVLSLISNSFQLYITFVNIDLLSGKYGYYDIILGVISAYLVLSFLDFYENDHLNAPRMMLATVMATIAVLNVVNQLVGVTPVGVMSVLEPVILFFFLYILFTALRSLDNVKKFASGVQRKSVNLMRYYFMWTFGAVSVVYTIIGVFSGTSLEDSEFFEFLNLVAPLILFLIADIYLYFGFVRIDNPAVLQPQQIDRFILISNVGLPLYYFKLESEMEGIDESLLSGAIAAISAVLKEATKVAGDLKSIVIGNSTILMNTLGDFTGLIFTYKSTRFLNSALANIMIQIDRILEIDDLGQLTGESEEQIEYIVTRGLGLKL